jgi:hypothetical protein
MSSAFLVFDLLGRDAGLEREGNARGFAHPNLTTLNNLPIPVVLWHGLPRRNFINPTDVTGVSGTLVL